GYRRAECPGGRAKVRSCDRHPHSSTHPPHGRPWGPFPERTPVLQRVLFGESSMRCVAFILVLLGVTTIGTAQEGIIPKQATLEKLWSEGEFTEGPAQGPDGCIYFSDIGNRILKFDPTTGKTTVYRQP